MGYFFFPERWKSSSLQLLDSGIDTCGVVPGTSMWCGGSWPGPDLVLVLQVLVFDMVAIDTGYPALVIIPVRTVPQNLQHNLLDWY